MPETAPDVPQTRPEWLTSLRKLAGITQPKLVEFAANHDGQHLSQQQLSLYERGEVSIDTDRFAELVELIQKCFVQRSQKYLALRKALFPAE